jgi:mRNA-degrading endonuclease toxin of MazEF toxin-antitoxin module
MRAHVFTIGLFLSSALSLNASERLAIAVSPRQSFAPASLVVRVHITPDVANRALEVVAESEDYYRSSRMQLDGEGAPATRLLEFRSLPSGDYDVRVNLLDSAGRQRASAREHVIVTPSGGLENGAP